MIANSPAPVFFFFFYIYWNVQPSRQQKGTEREMQTFQKVRLKKTSQINRMVKT